MLINKLKYFRIILFNLLLIIVACNTTGKKDQNIIEEHVANKTFNDSKSIKGGENKAIDTLKVTVVQYCFLCVPLSLYNPLNYMLQ